MKLTGADVTQGRLKFNSHLSHNPKCDILELKISQDAFITYCKELSTGKESMEYYCGENYVVGSSLKSNSRHYQENEIPKKYTHVWRSMREYYKNNCA